MVRLQDHEPGPLELHPLCRHALRMLRDGVRELCHLPAKLRHKGKA